MPQIDYVTEIRNLPALDIRSYDFAAQTPGGSLIIGSNSIMLHPMPPGITAASANNGVYLWISGGTGTDEAVLITGWSSTTVTVTCAHTHTGAWTVSSASGGLQEAIVATGGRGAVFIPSGFTTIHASVNISITVGDISVIGVGMSVSILARSTEYVAGNILSSSTVACGFTLRDITIYSPGFPVASNMTSGSAINISDQNAETTNIMDVKVIDGYRGITIAGSSRVNINNFEFFNRAAYSALYSSDAALTITNTASNQSGAIVAENLHVLMDDDDSANGLHYGIHIISSDGVQITDPDIKARIGMALTNDTYGITNVVVDGAIIDRVREMGVVFSGSASNFANVRLSNYHIVGYVSTSSHLTYGVFFDSTNASNIILSNGIVAGFATAGIGFAAGGTRDVTVSNSQIYANGQGLEWATGDGGTIVVGNRIGDLGGSVQQYGLYITGACAGITVIGNNLTGNLVAPIQGSTNMTSGIITDNYGFNPVGPSSVTVGASPYTYTNGPTEAVLCIFGGTVSDIKRGSTTVGTSSPAQITVPPFGTVTVTYSVAPTIVKDVQ